MPDLKKTIQIPADVHADIVKLKSKEAKALNLKSMTISDYLSRVVSQEKLRLNTK